MEVRKPDEISAFNKIEVRKLDETQPQTSADDPISVKHSATL